MADELKAVNLAELTMDDVKRLKNEAIARLKAAGQFTVTNAMHQNDIDHHNHHTAIASYPELDQDSELLEK